MKNLLAALFRRPQPIKLVPVNSLDLNMQAWRENEDLVKAWARLLRDPIVQSVIQTLRNESPLNYGVEMPTPDSKILRLGVIEGYQLALNNIEALANIAKKHQPIEATFEASEKPEPTE